MSNGSIDLLYRGSLTVAQMLTNQESANSTVKWILRILSFLFMWVCSPIPLAIIHHAMRTMW
jgi:hypothetical protein